MARFSIESVFKAIDKVSAPVKKMQARMGKFTRGITRGMRSANRSINKFGANLKKVAVIGTASLLSMGFVIGDIVKTGAEFEQTLVNAAAKFPEGIRRGTEAFKELEAVARRVGGTTEFTATQAAEGLEFLAFAGFNAKQSIEALPGIIDLATAASIDLGTAADIATDSLGAFGLATEDSVQQAKNLARVNDVLALTTTSANTDMVTLFEAVKKGGPAFTGAGQSIESFSALAGILANSSLKGSEAGTVLRNTMLRLGSASGDAAKLLKKHRIEVKDGENNFRDILDILVDFEGALKDMGTAEKSAALNTIFGSRAITGLSIALKSGSVSIAGYREKLRNAAGTSKEMASVMRDTLMGQFKSLLSGVESVKLSLFALKNEALEGTVVKLVAFVRSINTAINANKALSTEIVDGVLRTAVGLIGVFAQLVILFVTLKAVTLAWSAATIMATVFMVGYNTVVGLGTALMGKQLAVANASKIAMIAFAVGTKIAAAAQWLFNAALSANPIGLIIVAVGALIAMGVLLAKNWDTIVEAISDAVSRIKGLLDILFKPLTTVLSGFSSIFGAAKSLGLIGGGTAEEEGVAEATPSLVTPQERIARTIEERNEKSTVDINIKDEGGRAEVEKKGASPGVKIELLATGAL